MHLFYSIVKEEIKDECLYRPINDDKVWSIPKKEQFNRNNNNESSLSE